MPTYGLITEGFLAKTLDVIRADMATALENAFSQSVRTDDQSVLGQLIGIVAERLALLWEQSEVVYNMMDPDAATGAALEQLCLLTGTIRPPATYSAVNLILTGDSTTNVPAGSEVKLYGADVHFTTNETVTLVAVDNWATATAYTVGDIVNANDGVFYCTTAGTSDVSGTGPVPQTGPVSLAITDGTVNWLTLGPGSAYAEVVGTCTVSGIVAAAAGYVIELVSTITGWDGVINLEDAIPGREIATDAELRLLREQELAAGGSTPINALRAELLQIKDVVSVSVFQNIDDVVDADGLPPHSVEAVVRGPLSPTADFDQSIFDALLNGVAAGIKTASATGATSVTGTAVDDQLTSHSMTFSRPTEHAIKIILNIVVDPDVYPSDGEDQIKELITIWGDQQATGKDVVASKIASLAFGVDGVLDSTALIALSPTTPTLSTTLPMTLRDLATYDTSLISIVATPGTP